MIVGKDETKFEVHKDLLCQHSSFFSGCLEADFAEASSKEILLPDDHPVAVRIFVKWIYNRQIDIEEELNAGHAIVPIYQFADKICAQEYHNHLMDAIVADIKKERKVHHPSAISMLYEKGLGRTPLATFILESYVFQMLSHPGPWKARLAEASQEARMHTEAWYVIPELMKDWLAAIVDHQHQPRAKPSSETGCRYHRHEKEADCAPAPDIGAGAGSVETRPAWQGGREA